MAQSTKIFCEQFVLKQGKCKCPGYVENPSKWSKGKCRRCLHDKNKHNFFDEETPDTDSNAPSNPIAVNPKSEEPKVPETTSIDQINSPSKHIQTEETKTMDDILDNDTVDDAVDDAVNDIVDEETVGTVDTADPVDEPEEVDLGKDPINEAEPEEMKQEELETMEIAVDPVDEAEEVKVADDGDSADGITLYITLWCF